MENKRKKPATGRMRLAASGEATLRAVQGENDAALAGERERVDRLERVAEQLEEIAAGPAPAAAPAPAPKPLAPAEIREQMRAAAAKRAGPDGARPVTLFVEEYGLEVEVTPGSGITRAAVLAEAASEASAAQAVEAGVLLFLVAIRATVRIPKAGLLFDGLSLAEMAELPLPVLALLGPPAAAAAGVAATEGKDSPPAS